MLRVNASLGKHGLGASEALFDLEEILGLSICYLFYFRAQIALRAVVQVSTIKPTGADGLPAPHAAAGRRLPTSLGRDTDLCFVLWSP